MTDDLLAMLGWERRLKRIDFASIFDIGYLGIEYRSFQISALKIKTLRPIRGRSVSSAVPPQFAVLDGALGDRQSSVFAITGNPVLV